MGKTGTDGRSGDAVQQVLNAVHSAGCAEFSVGSETYLIQPENNKGWDYLSIWRTGAMPVCLDRAFFDLRCGIDADTVSELLHLPCIQGCSLLDRLSCGEIEWL